MSDTSRSSNVVERSAAVARQAKRLYAFDGWFVVGALLAWVVLLVATARLNITDVVKEGLSWALLGLTTGAAVLLRFHFLRSMGERRWVAWKDVVEYGCERVAFGFLANHLERGPASDPVWTERVAHALLRCLQQDGPGIGRYRRWQVLEWIKHRRRCGDDGPWLDELEAAIRAPGIRR